MMVPTGSVVGIGLICVVIGVLIGRSARAMTGIARAHAAAHAGAAASAEVSTDVDQNVVVVVDRDGVERIDGRYRLDEHVTREDRVNTLVGSVRGALDEGPSPTDGYAPAQPQPVRTPWEP